MIERFIPVTTTSTDELQDVLSATTLEYRGYTQRLPFFLNDAEKIARKFSPTTSAAASGRDLNRDLNPDLWTPHLLLWNERPIAGPAKTLPRHSFVLAQKIESPEYLKPSESYAYVGIFNRKREVPVVLESTDSEQIKHLTVGALFSYLCNASSDVSAQYRPKSEKFENLISERTQAYQLDKAKNLVNRQFLKHLPKGVVEFNELWNKHNATVFEASDATDSQKSTARNFLSAIEYLGIHGMSKYARDWYKQHFSAGTEYISACDALSQERLDIIHSDPKAVVKIVSESGHFLSHTEYNEFSPGIPDY